MLTPAQLATRKTSLGCSDLPALFGFSRFANVADLWMEKFGDLEPDDSSEAALMGTDAEDFIATVTERKLGVRLVKPTGTYRHPNLALHANLDRQYAPAKRGAVNVECKCIAFPEGWGDEGTDQVPDGVMLQVQGQMMCSESPYSIVARLTGGRYGIRVSLYRVEPHDMLRTAIADKVRWFWEQTKCPEPGPRLATLERVVRRHGEMVDVPDSLIEELSAARKAVTLAEAHADECKAHLLAAMGTAECGTGEKWTATYNKSMRKGYTVPDGVVKKLTLKRSTPDGE